jgi:cell fate (sporulation/competence/biofilm development) regulator YlbF (YheA/YmcA/DUF963 family)
MTTTTTDDAILQKTKELCQTIVDQPEFQAVRRQVDAFMASEESKSQYQLLVEKGEALQHKQQTGMPLSHDEIAAFEKQRDLLINNPIAKGFLDAQQEIHKVQESVGQYVSKTLELGRIPTDEDFPSDSCGHGCGCHH